MKYMVPEINISKFSVENIVTVSAIGQAKAELAKVSGLETGNIAVTNLSLNDWVQQ